MEFSFYESHNRNGLRWSVRAGPLDEEKREYTIIHSVGGPIECVKQTIRINGDWNAKASAFVSTSKKYLEGHDQAFMKAVGDLLQNDPWLKTVN